MFLRDSRLFLRSLINVLIIGIILIAGCLAVVLSISNKEAGDSKVLTLALVNEDTDSNFSDLVLNIAAENENISDAVKIVFADSESKAVEMVKDGLSGALIIPKGFFSSVYYGENYPCKIILNTSLESSASVLKYYTELASDLLSTTQYIIYSGDVLLAQNNASDIERTNYNEALNMQFVGEMASSPDNYFIIENVGYTKSGLPFFAHFVVAYLSFFFGLLTICFFHLYHDDTKKEKLVRLFSCKVSKAGYLLWKVLLPALLFMVLTAIVLAAGNRFGMTNFKIVSIAYSVCAVLFITMFAALFGVALGESAAAAMFVISFVSLFFIGGIIPYANLSTWVTFVGKFTPLGVVYNMFSPAFGGNIEILPVVAGIVYLLIGVILYRATLKRIILGKGTV